jgi:Protein of unknown function (DUF2939)
MRTAARISLVFLVLLAGYTVWPFFDLFQIARAIEQRDAATLSERVEFRPLRTSVNRQVLGTYLRLTGKEARLGPFNDAAVGLAVSVADAALADIGSAEKLLEMFAKGWPPAGAGHGIDPAGKESAVIPRTLGTAWKLYAGSEYRLNDFYVSVPPDVAPAQGFRLQLRLTQWLWKLRDVQLPNDLRVQLAQDLIRTVERN